MKNVKIWVFGLLAMILLISGGYYVLNSSSKVSNSKLAKSYVYEESSNVGLMDQNANDNVQKIAGDSNIPNAVHPQIEVVRRNEVHQNVRGLNKKSNDNIKLEFSEILNPWSYSVDYIDQTYLSHGEAFNMNVRKLRTLSKGSVVSIKFRDEWLAGKVSKMDHTKLKNYYVKIDLDDQAEGRYLLIFMTEKIARGKIYTADNSYMFEHNYNIGYMMPILEYKRINNVLLND